MSGMVDLGAFSRATRVFPALPGPGTPALLSSTALGGFAASAAAILGIAMTFVLLFLGQARQLGIAMIAGIMAMVCLSLCTLAQPLGEQIRAHRRLARRPERASGLHLIGFGIRHANS